MKWTSDAIADDILHPILVRARRIQAERGHVKYMLEDPHTHAVCFQGALMIAIHGSVRDPLNRLYESWAILHQAAVVTGLSGVYPNDGLVGAVNYNNHPDTTLDDILAAFDRGIAATAPKEVTEESEPRELVLA